MTDWNNSCNYKNNFNKPNISHSKTYKGKYKKICDGCLNPSNSNNKKSIDFQICEKPICPGIIEIYNISDCVYKPNFKNSKKIDMKKICKEKVVDKPELISCKKEKIKINMDKYCKDQELEDKCHHIDKGHHIDKDKDKINEFISLLTNKIINS